MQWYCFASKDESLLCIDFSGHRLGQVTDISTYIVMPSPVSITSHYHQQELVLLFPVLQESLSPAGPEPTIKDYVMCRGQNAFRVVPFEAQEAALSGPLIKVCHLLPCLKAGCKGGHKGRLVGIRNDWGGGCLRCQSQSCEPWSRLLLSKDLETMISLLLSQGHLDCKQHVSDR